MKITITARDLSKLSMKWAIGLDGFNRTVLTIRNLFYGRYQYFNTKYIIIYEKYYTYLKC